MSTPSAFLTSNGTIYTLVLGVDEMRRVEDSFDLPLIAVLNRIGDTTAPRIGDFARFLAATVKTDNSIPLTLEQAATVIEGAGMSAVVNAIGALLLGAAELLAS